MNLLILGGTAFLGPAIVDSARTRGWTVTLFNRGKTNPGLFKDIEQIHGDRDPNKAPGLQPLADAIKAGRTWDAVIDTSAYVPRITRASAELLKPVVRQYVLITTVNVYAEPLYWQNCQNRHAPARARRARARAAGSRRAKG